MGKATLEGSEASIKGSEVSQGGTLTTAHVPQTYLSLKRCSIFHSRGYIQERPQAGLRTTLGERMNWPPSPFGKCSKQNT